MIASWLLIVIAIVVIVGLALLATKSCGRSLLKLFAGGLVLFILLQFVYLQLSYTPAVIQVVRESKLNKSSLLPAGATTEADSDAVGISTEQIWLHLTTPQIVLDNITDEKPTEEIDLTEPEESEPARPAWVDLPPKQIGNVYRVAISSGPYKTKPECYHALEILLGKEVQQRIEHLMPDAKIPDPAQLGITAEYILEEICNKNKTWVETTEASFGKMKQVHVQMEFTAATEKHLQTTFRNHQRQARVAKVGGIAGLGLGGLALLYGLLRVSSSTKNSNF